MKKILTFFCALVFILGANAAPQLSKKMSNNNLPQLKVDYRLKKNASPASVPSKARKAVAGIVPVDTAEVELSNIELVDYTTDSSEPWFQIVGDNAGYPGGVYVCVNTNSLTGTFANADIDLDYSGLFIDDEDGIYPVEANGKVTKSGNTYTYDFYLIDVDEHCYHVYGDFTIPVVESTVDFVATNLVIDDSYFDLYMAFMGYGVFSINASNAEGLELLINFTSLDEVSGTYSANYMSGSIGTSKIYSGSVVVDATKLTVSGSVLCFNNVQYNLDLSFETPEPTETISFTAPAGEYEYYEEFGDYYITAYSADYTYGIALDIITDNLVGTYDLDDLDASYTGIYQFDATGNTVEQWSLLSCSATITQNQDGTYKCVMTGQGLGSADKTSSPSFSITINNISVAEYHPDYDEEDAGCTSEVFDEYAIDNSYLTQGMVFVDAFNDNVTASIGFMVNPEEGLVPGTYVIADTQEEGTVMEGAFDEGSIYPSYVATLGDDGLSTPIWYFISGTVTVEDDMDIVVDALNSYNQPIQFTLPAAASGLDRHYINGDVMKYFYHNHLIIRANNMHYMMSGAAF
ncbi:MAG: hypothetical protein MJZ75_02735 [Paludibacteraceae bacterium]|nr:hypothetical protein [Paludibacteraceae bacterium]